MVLIGAFNAIARYATPYIGISLSSNALNELQWYIFSVIFLLGAAYGLRVDAHVRVDVVYSRLSRKAKGWVDLLGTLIFLLPFCAVMLWVSYPTVRNSFIIREVSPDPGGLPRWPIKALILVSFALLLLQGIALAIRSVEKIRGVGEGDGDAAKRGPEPPDPAPVGAPVTAGGPPHQKIDADHGAME